MKGREERETEKERERGKALRLLQPFKLRDIAKLSR